MFKLRKTEDGYLYFSGGRYEVGIPLDVFMDILKDIKKNISLYNDLLDIYVKTFAGKFRIFSNILSVATLLDVGREMILTLKWFDEVKIIPLTKNKIRVISWNPSKNYDIDLLAEFTIDVMVRVLSTLNKNFVYSFHINEEDGTKKYILDIEYG